MSTILKLEKSKFKIEIFGNIVEIRKPNWSEIEKFQDAAEDDKGSMSRTRELFVNIGIPAEIVKDLEMEHITAIMELLVPKKKDSQEAK